MKFLILLLILSISAQPLRAGFCDMEMDAENNQEMSHHMDPSDNDNQGGHDCCGSDDGDSQEGCDSEMNCGFCFVSVSAVPGMARVSPQWAQEYSLVFSSGFILPSHSPPPFRPPIS